ncbi:aldose epimerase family protein [Acidiphilium sp.]|uniref:aldose epimerase family protein n=1 Tax=Acidiphilium sp. TaxID=527 RepID=UPI003CFCF240
MTNAEIATYGTTSAGAMVRRIVLRNAHGLSVGVLDYGGVITDVMVPDRAGVAGNVVLGCATIADYQTKSSYFGALLGRYANRIAGAAFTLDGHVFHLPANNGANTLHGGPKIGPTPNFAHRVWTIVDATASAVTLRLVSADGDNGFPGTLTVEVTYRLGDDQAFRIDYTARVEGRPTVLNVSNHTYFNLAGSGSALDHEVIIPAASFLPTDAAQIPTGILQPVAGTPMDFRTAHTPRARIGADFEQLKLAGGYDHCFVLEHEAGALGVAARLTDPVSGRTLTIETTQPAVQFYTGNKLDGTIQGANGALIQAGDGMAFETQHFPDAPNRPHFPSTRLDPGQDFRSTTIWRFGLAP